MNINELRRELSIRCKNGIAFLLAAILAWCIILIIFISPLSIEQKNLYTFFSTGILFPCAVLFSKLLKCAWQTNDHPLGMLGLYLNIAQVIYFPILFFSFAQTPEYFIIFFAIITAAHLYPYGWYYQEKTYYFISPLLSFSILLLSFNITSHALWAIPALMLLGLGILTFILGISYQNKTKH